jgi:hypothetical protein
MRVGIIAFFQEFNTFIGQPTKIEHFEQDQTCPLIDLDALCGSVFENS